MHNIMKIYAWAEPYVNFLKGETSPLLRRNTSYPRIKSKFLLLDVHFSIQISILRVLNYNHLSYFTYSIILYKKCYPCYFWLITGVTVTGVELKITLLYGSKILKIFTH